jgi:serine/threonine protein kinase
MPEAAPLEPGDPVSLGDFEVIGRLGMGGQGAVFLGRGPDGAQVAIKLLHAQMSADTAARARFTRELEAAQKVAPFCTAQVLESDVHGDQPYIVSEYIDGPSLHDVVAQKGPIPARDLDRLAIGTATALAAIHEAGIVHRDFKPNNVLLAADGPRVVDFGIARTVGSEESSVTATGMVVGTPGYLAPEQLTGAALTPAVDIFAWGATMVFAATGRSPFEADALPVIINKILNTEPDLSALQGSLRDLVGRCLAKDPAGRPPSHQLLLQLLGHAGAAPGPATGGAELLGQGTRIAAQMPPPPPIAPPVAAMTPPPQPITPYPPPIMHQGPSTPPPMQLPTQPPMRLPPVTVFGPPAPLPPRRSGPTGPVIAGVGCLVLALLVVFFVALGVAVSRDPRPRITTSTSPSSGYTPFGNHLLNPNFAGTWTGHGYQTKGSTTDWNITLTLTAGRLIGQVRYPDCSGSLLVESSDADKTELHETIISNEGGCYPSGYVTLQRVSSTTLRYEWRRYASDTEPWATGTVTKSRSGS